MKIYTLAELKKIVRDQEFKMAALRGPDGEKVVPFNRYKKTARDLDDQFKIFETRLKGNIYPDGVYYVLLAHNINSARSPKEFPIKKGNVSIDELQEAEKKAMPLTPATIVKHENVLTWESAVEMNKQIAELTAKVSSLEFENKQLLERIAELEEEEEDEGVLAEGSTGSTLLDGLKSLLPTIQAGVEKHFELEEKRLNLRELELRSANSSQVKQPGPTPVKKLVRVGSQEHLDFIEKLFVSEAPDSEELLNIELDKLQGAKPELYEAVMQKLFPDQGTQGGAEGQDNE